MFKFNNLVRLLASALVASAMSATAWGAVTWDLQATNPANYASPYPSFTANDLGNNLRGVVFDVTTDFTLVSTGIYIDPLAAAPSPFTLNAYIYGVVLDGSQNGIGSRGALLASASQAFTDLGFQFYMVNLSYNFVASNRYEIAFDVNGGFGTAKFSMQFQHFDPTRTPYNPFNVAGYVTMVDGSANNYLNDNYPRVQITFDAIPEPSTWSMIGLGLAGLAFLRRRRR